MGGEKGTLGGKERFSGGQLDESNGMRKGRLEKGH